MNPVLRNYCSDIYHYKCVNIKQLPSTVVNFILLTFINQLATDYLSIFGEVEIYTALNAFRNFSHIHLIVHIETYPYA